VKKDFKETLSPSELKREIYIAENKVNKLKMRLADAQEIAKEGPIRDRRRLTPDEVNEMKEGLAKMFEYFDNEYPFE
jgi:hypothetical protein